MFCHSSQSRLLVSLLTNYRRLSNGVGIICDKMPFLRIEISIHVAPEHTMKPDKIPLGDNIRIARARLGYSQEYVADRLGISKQRYRQLENEEQDSLTFGRLSEIGSILETDIETLMTLHRTPFAVDRMSAQDTLILALNQLIQTQQELMIVLQKNLTLE